jgi:hypothetical protein
VHGTVAALIGVAFFVHGVAPLLRLRDPMTAMQPMVVPFGLALIALLGVQVAVGFQWIPLHRRFRSTHIALASLILLLGLVHGTAIATGATHPKGLSAERCAVCHVRPAAHFAGACHRCHRSPGVAWSFDTHPAIPGGEHTYRSFSCANCHPGRDYARFYCSCHPFGKAPVGD